MGRAKFSTWIKLVPPGPIAEFGVYEGKATVGMSRHRKTYAFDTFDGMPPNTSETPYDPTLDSNNPPGKFKPSFDVITRFKKHKYNIVCVPGTFQSTLPKFDPTIKFAFIYLDCDWYSSYSYVINWLANHIVPGAVAIVDDYPGCKGCVKAIHELVESGLIRFNKNCNLLTWTEKRPWLLL